MKQSYEKPDLEITEFEIEEDITSSGVGDDWMDGMSGSDS